MLDNWSYKWFGFFRDITCDGTDENGSNLPDIRELVDAKWTADEKRKVLNYLKLSPVVVTGSGPSIECEICGMAMPSSSFQSDGEWLWPESLAHYLEMHDVALPSAFIMHMREAGFVAPQVCNLDIFDLPWPN